MINEREVPRYDPEPGQDLTEKELLFNHNINYIIIIHNKLI